jgi:hypothetical protein
VEWRGDELVFHASARKFNIDKVWGSAAFNWQRVELHAGVCGTIQILCPAMTMRSEVSAIATSFQAGMVRLCGSVGRLR